MAGNLATSYRPLGTRVAGRHHCCRGIELELSFHLDLRRGPQKTPTKQRVTLRLSPEVVQHYKAGGPGWQTRIDLDLLGKIGARNKGRVATASAPRRHMTSKAA
jgi:hypothetical protein